MPDPAHAAEDALRAAAPQHEDPLRRQLRHLADLWDTAAEEADRDGHQMYAQAVRTCSLQLRREISRE